jgi:prepilin-type N-terminal cleavage/methylation domain-containing protein
MQKLMKRFHKNQKGFTLVELMVVVVIIGILVAIAVPIYNAVTDRAEESACHANLRTIDGAKMMANAADDTAGYPANYFMDGNIPICPADPPGNYTGTAVTDDAVQAACDLHPR